MTSAPILPGFHPDPSIRGAGDACYLATSSFEYVPIHRSTDLVTWEPVGHAIADARVVAAPSGAAGAGSGIFAPPCATVTAVSGSRPRRSDASATGS